MKKNRWDQTGLLISNIFFAVPNIMFIVRGFYSRYWADDYCFTGIYRSYGLIKGLSHFYNNISNRFAAYIFIAFSEFLGNWMIRVIPSFVIFSLGILIYFVIKKIASLADVQIPSMVLLLSSQSIIFFTLLMAPNIDQSVYWRSGLTHYFLPLVFLLSFLLIFLHDFSGRPFRRISMVIFLLAFFGGGLSESYAALQTGSIVLTLVFCLLKPRRVDKEKLFQIILGLLGSFLAMLVMVIAPGNQMRLGMYQQAPNLISIAVLSLKFAVDFIYFSIRGYWIPTIVSIGMGLLMGIHYSRTNQMKENIAGMVIIIITAFFLVACVIAPTVYGMMAYPEHRVMLLARFIMVSGILIFWFFLGGFFKRILQKSGFVNQLNAIGLLVLCLYPLWQSSAIFNSIKLSIDRARLWDDRNNQILEEIAEGEIHIQTNALDAFSEIAELDDDPAFWVNQCAAEFYGVKAITAIE